MKEQNHFLLNHPLSPSGPLTLNRRTFIAGLGGASVLLAAAPSAAWATPFNALDLTALEARHGGRIGVCAESSTGRVGWRTEERFAYCSTFKLFLAACILERVQRGLETLDRPIAISKSDMVAHAPITEPAIGSTLTVEQLCKATVEVSDNPAANILIREMGGLDPWQAWYRAIGDKVTRVDRYEVDLNSAIHGDPRDTTTPEQALANLETVLRGSLLSPEHLSLLETWLVDTPTGAGRIKAGVPSGCRVGHKTGTGSRGTQNDIGIIWPPAGSPILIVVYFTGALSASPEERDAIVAEATRMSLQALGHR